jgi:flagellar basal body-associated protein FliL
MSYALPVALTGGSLIVVIVVVAVVFALAYGAYTRKGSGIDQHPRGAGHAGDPGVGESPSRMSSREDETEGVPDQHGTR